MKKIFISWFGSFIVMFSLAGLFNGIIIKEFVNNNIVPEMLNLPPNMLLIAGGYLLLAVLMVLLFPKVINEENYSIKSGFMFGVFISILWLLPISLVLHGAYNFPILALLIDSGWAVVEQGLGGIVIGLCYKYIA